MPFTAKRSGRWAFAVRCAALGGQGRAVVEITEGQGLDAAIERLVLDALDRNPDIGAVCSIGAAMWPPFARLNGAADDTGRSSPTISTRTIGCCCAPARSRPCYITT